VNLKEQDFLALVMGLPEAESVRTKDMAFENPALIISARKGERQSGDRLQTCVKPML